MSNPTEPQRSRDEEADRLWLARAIASPDAWRLRATNAAGLLSAAAAASVAGLLLQGDSTGQALQGMNLFIAISAAVGYVVAVVAFLAASVWRSPETDRETLSLAEEIWDYCVEEAKPIKRAVWIGSVFATIAIIATALTFASLLAGYQRSQNANVVVVGEQELAGVQALCPQIPKVIPVSLRVVSTDRILLRIPADFCGESPAEIEMPKDQVLIRYDD
jgi:hypothetical protein